MVKTGVPVNGFGRSWVGKKQFFKPNPMVPTKSPESLIFQGFLMTPKPTKKTKNIQEPHPEAFTAKASLQRLRRKGFAAEASPQRLLMRVDLADLACRFARTLVG